MKINLNQMNMIMKMIKKKKMMTMKQIMMMMKKMKKIKKKIKVWTLLLKKRKIMLNFNSSINSHPTLTETQ